MPKHWVWLSTLSHLAGKLEIEKELIEEKFAHIHFDHPGDEDVRVEISTEEREWIDSLCRDTSYSSCSSCYKPLCGSHTHDLCSCLDTKEEQANYQREYQLLIADTQAARHSLAKLTRYAFRQSRNGFGESGIIFGGAKLVLEKIPLALSATSMALALFIPGAILGGYIYYRGRKEEQAYNADAEADLLEKQVNLFSHHRACVRSRHQNKGFLLRQEEKPGATPSAVINRPNPFFLTHHTRTKPKPPKEKRGVLGNPLSHFIGSGFATWSILNSCIGLGILSFIPGGILGVLLVVGVSALVGGYFAYKRYHHLQKKLTFERQMARLTARDQDITSITTAVEKATSTLSLSRSSISHTRVRRHLCERKRQHQNSHSVPSILQSPDLTSAPARNESFLSPVKRFRRHSYPSFNFAKKSLRAKKENTAISAKSVMPACWHDRLGN